VSLADFSAFAKPEEQSAFFAAIAHVIEAEGLSDDGFRAIANTGLHGGQEVPHFHIHLLGGRALGPMLARAG